MEDRLLSANLQGTAAVSAGAGKLGQSHASRATRASPAPAVPTWHSDLAFHGVITLRVDALPDTFHGCAPLAVAAAATTAVSVACSVAESLSTRQARSSTGARLVAAGGAFERHSLTQQVSRREAVVRVVQAFTRRCRRGKLPARGAKLSARLCGFSVQVEHSLWLLPRFQSKLPPSWQLGVVSLVSGWTWERGRRSPASSRKGQLAGAEVFEAVEARASQHFADALRPRGHPHRRCQAFLAAQATAVQAQR